jgi:hypothetical protein
VSYQCLAVLQFCKRHFCLFNREFPCDISMYICIITRVDSSPLFFFFLP